MSFDALTYAGLISAALSGGFLLALATSNTLERIRDRAPTRNGSSRRPAAAGR